MIVTRFVTSRIFSRVVLFVRDALDRGIDHLLVPPPRRGQLAVDEEDVARVVRDHVKRVRKWVASQQRIGLRARSCDCWVYACCLERNCTCLTCGSASSSLPHTRLSGCVGVRLHIDVDQDAVANAGGGVRRSPARSG